MPDGAVLSGDGEFVVTFDSGGTHVTDRFSGASSSLAGHSTCLWPVISDNANYIVALDSSNGGLLVVAPNPLNLP